jgi:fructokinase
MIVSCGEALIDFLPADVGGRAGFSAAAGGSPFNVAIAAGRLGAPAGFFGGLSTDLFGDILRAALDASGVDASLAQVSERPSTLAFVSLAGGSARYAFFDEQSAGRMLSEADLPAFPRTVTALHFGSFSLAEEPCGTAFEALMQREQRDRVISLDLNIRPTLIHNRDGHIARLDRLIEMADIVRASDEDLEWLEPGADAAEMTARFLKRGAKLVVLTRGADGALAATRHETVTVPAPTVIVADTVGAGDTFTGALLAHLHEQNSLSKQAIAKLGSDALRAALDYAARAAAITVSRPGCDPPWRRELT